MVYPLRFVAAHGGHFQGVLDSHHAGQRWPRSLGFPRRITRCQTRSPTDPSSASAYGPARQPPTASDAEANLAGTRPE